MLHLCPAVRAQEHDTTTERGEIISDLVKAADKTWRAVSTPDRRYSTRSLFSGMLAYTQADIHPERVAHFIQLAEKLQERTPDHQHLGNFFWYSNESEVLDRNAVDFCMQHAALIWKLHRDRLDPESRERLHGIISRSITGLINHLPRPSYTNIALMNASNLILLGEALAEEDAGRIGRSRLVIFIRTLFEEGLHEYVSPTYYGVDLETALLLEALSENADVRRSAAAIRQLLESDIALNRLDKRVVLSGTCSRTYDFLYKFGILDSLLIPFGWMARPDPASGIRFAHRSFASLYTEHRPSKETMALAEIFPRTVQQRWGARPHETRMHYLCRDVSLSSSSAGYGKMDIPLSVDLPYSGIKPEVQLYFLPDGRNDPYGRSKIIAGNHNKALHLTPWWRAVQSENCALAMVFYDSSNLDRITETLQSHLVFRRGLDGLWIDNHPIEIDSLKQKPLKLDVAQTLFLREGTAAVAIRIPWARGIGDYTARTTLVDDGRHQALRLTVSHGVVSPDKPEGSRCAGAVFAVQTGSGIVTDSQFNAFRKALVAAPVQIRQAGFALEAAWQSEGKSLQLRCADTSFPAAVTMQPQPATPILAVNGRDIGSEILQRSPCVSEYLKTRQRAVTIDITPEAATALLVCDCEYSVPIVMAAENGRDYLWVEEHEGARSWNAGALHWQLNIIQAGNYIIEAEVLAPTPEDDSFYFSIYGADGREIVPEFAWSTGVNKNWRWARVRTRGRSGAQSVFKLPAGRAKLVFRTREAGTKISGARLTRQP